MSFKDLLSLNVNDKTTEKGSGRNALTYLSWSFAWSEFVKVYPEATYGIGKNENGLPYFVDESGAMCYTKVTANNLTHEMWLPVMNGANKAMKLKPYTYKVKDWNTKQMVEKPVEALTMFDVNKTVMRCLVKNLAMFGLGLYIYAGEDLPEAPQQTPEELKAIEDAKNEKIKLNNLKKEIGATLLKLTEKGINKKAIENSIEHHLKVKSLIDCNDIEKLQNYYLYKTNQLTELLKGEK